MEIIFRLKFFSSTSYKVLKRPLYKSIERCLLKLQAHTSRRRRRFGLQNI